MGRIGIAGKILLIATAFIVVAVFAVAFALNTGKAPADTSPATESSQIQTQPPVTEPPVTEPPVTEPPVTEPPVTTPAVVEPDDKREKTAFLAAGDNIVYRPNIWEAQENANDGGMDFSSCYKNVAQQIAQADIAFINQETLLCGAKYAYSGYPLFNGPTELGEYLCRLGFDVINIASNHMLDMGYNYGAYSTGEGIGVTRDFWDTQPATVIGGYRDAADMASIRTVEKNGVKIAFLAYTEETNTIKLDPASKAVVPYLDDTLIRSQTAAARAVADVVIVSAHWGVDGSSVISDKQRHYAALFAECGVDVVIGHHPHILQSIEWIDGEDGHKTLCAYSLGNFVAIMERPLHFLGGFLGFDITPQNGGGVSIENVYFTPTVYHYNEWYRQNCVYYLADYTQSVADSHGAVKKYDAVISLDEYNAFLLSTIGAQYLREYPEAH